jgi:hypothetical protein
MVLGLKKLHERHGIVPSSLIKKQLSNYQRRILS